MSAYRGQVIAWLTAVVALVLAVLLGYVWEVPNDLAWPHR
jgi:hypothetical protein